MTTVHLKCPKNYYKKPTPKEYKTRIIERRNIKLLTLPLNKYELTAMPHSKIYY